jgi:hypothetical protein
MAHDELLRPLAIPSKMSIALRSHLSERARPSANRQSSKIVKDASRMLRFHGEHPGIAKQLTGVSPSRSIFFVRKSPRVTAQ